MTGHDSQPNGKARGSKPSPARRLVRLAFVIAGAASVFYLTLLALAPLLVSSGIVRDALENAVSDWTGHHATIGGNPEIIFWPEPTITLPAVTIFRGKENDEVVLARMERLSATFGLVDAMLGKPLLREFYLVRPEIDLSRDAAGTVDWAGDGLLASAVRTVSAGGEVVADATIGEVTIMDGRVRINDAVTNRRIVIDDVQAKLGWPRLSTPMALLARAQIAGQRVDFELRSDTPLLLFGGKDADLSVELRLPGFVGRFDGTANIAGDYVLQGDLRFDADDAPAFFSAAGLTLRGMETMKTASLSASVTTIAGSYRLDDLEASFDESDATGILELALPPDRKAQLSGTLAFDHIDLSGLLASLTLIPSAGGGEIALPNWLDFDFTLSAEIAEFGALSLRDMATSVTISGDSRRFEIIDSTFEDGELTARVTDAAAGRPAEVELRARDVDFGALVDRLALAGPLPRATGSAFLSLRAARPLAQSRLADLDGSLRVEMGPGAWRPLDLEGIRGLARQKPFFRLSEAPGGELKFTSLNLAARLKLGSAELEKVLIGTEMGMLTLGGIVPYSAGGLGLAVAMTLDGEDGSASTAPLRLFIAGSWPDPILSPITP